MIKGWLFTELKFLHSKDYHENMRKLKDFEKVQPKSFNLTTSILIHNTAIRIQQDGKSMF